MSTTATTGLTLMLVEDDQRLAQLTMEFLTKQGFHVLHESDGQRAATRILAEQPALVLLDIMLPNMDGMQVCRMVRASYRQPILMLTARDADSDQVLGLEIGADDYVVKPVEPPVLLARIRALLRRYAGNSIASSTTHASPSRALTIGGLSLNLESRQVLLDGAEVRLGGVEFDLLWLLATHAGTALERKRLVAALRKIEYDGFDRSIDIAISRLRRKLGDDADSPTRIKTLRGRGYLLVPDAW